MASLTSRQAIQIFGWLNVRTTLTWNDVLRLRLSLDQLMAYGLRAAELFGIQPDPVQWIRHAGAGLKHARFMQPWGANPFVHFGADLADVLSMELTVVELVRMNVTYAQLLEHGMTQRTEAMFKLDEAEWEMLGKRSQQ